MKKILFILSLTWCASVKSQSLKNGVGTTFPSGNVPVHDPAIIGEGATCYIFSTGNGINVYRSKNLVDWKREPPVFKTAPQWAEKMVPGYKGHTWAPDIQFVNGSYYLYYSVSTFGKNRSAIGLAINKTLDPASPDFLWQDKGMVVASVPGRDDWNAIDPNLVVDDNGEKWLSFGSFWSGIKLVKLNGDGTAPAEPQEWHTIAARKNSNAIEAPYIFKHGKYFYLFASWDLCCQGLRSTYKVVVGRSEKVTGSYLDKNGVAMKLGGGSLLIEGDKINWQAVGHNGVATLNGADYIVLHGYDLKDNGSSKLILRKLGWSTDGWPEVNTN